MNALNVAASTTPPTADPNQDEHPVQMANTINSVSSYLGVKHRDTLGGDIDRRDTRASTIRETIIMSEDGTYDYDLEQTVFTKGEMKFIKNVLKSCTAENGFDLYQLMAFDGAKGTKEGCWSYLKYYVHMVKAILCMFIFILFYIQLIYMFLDLIIIVPCSSLLRWIDTNIWNNYHYD